MITKEMMLARVHLLNEANGLYHDGLASKLRDVDYDRLYRELVEWEKTYPQLIVPYSPTKKVGSPSVKNTLRLYKRMYSLENAFSEQDVLDYEASIRNIFKRFDMHTETPLLWHVSQKLDGLAAELVYHNGTLMQAATRGDGHVGEGLFPTVNELSTIPKQLVGPGVMSVMAVHGELIYVDPNNQVIDNARNIAVGLIKRKEKSEAFKHLQFVAYDVIGVEGATHTERMQVLSQLGFKIAKALPDPIPTKDIESVQTREELCYRENPVGYAMDGMVYRLDSIELSNLAGFTQRAPRFAFAYKFKNNEVTTVVKDIVVQVSRLGKLTPVAKLEPVIVDGATVSSVTLDNQNIINQLGLAIGDTVSVVRSGGVIPKILSVLPSEQEDKTVWQLPKTCPSCGEPVHREADKVDVFCTNLTSCKERHVAAIEYALGKQVLNIKGFGPSLIRHLVYNHEMFHLRSFLILEVSELIEKGELSSKVATRLAKELRERRPPKLYIALMALNIPGLGLNAARSLAQYITNTNIHPNILQWFLHLTEGQLNQVPGLRAETIAELLYASRDYPTLLNLETVLRP